MRYSLDATSDDFLANLSESDKTGPMTPLALTRQSPFAGKTNHSLYLAVGFIAASTASGGGAIRILPSRDAGLPEIPSMRGIDGP